ncbi:hypothetical protein KC19_7G147500 [Ceratodon purpureus]|uniref:Uncharacterized protein n=1 Tax=Ceratodon purpureus TaxID=3225 RepID=A0A8T0HB92_CERPU|nr:hypothetical protein KC19_7G147500 [Ceratodon purpureus]
MSITPSLNINPERKRCRIWQRCAINWVNIRFRFLSHQIRKSFKKTEGCYKDFGQFLTYRQSAVQAKPRAKAEDASWAARHCCHGP